MMRKEPDLIRRAGPKDLVDVCRMAQSLFSARHFEKLRVSYESVESGLSLLLDDTISDGAVFVASLHGCPVGFVAGRISAPWYAWHVTVAEVLALWVDAEQRRIAIGRRLVEAFVAWGTQHRVAAIQVPELATGNSVPAAQLFKSLGFLPAERSQIKVL